MKLGFSLSGCVNDIASGLVPESQVAGIITGTAIRNVVDFHLVLDRYWPRSNHRYTHESNLRRRRIANRLYRRGLLGQPRLAGYDAPTGVGSFDYRWCDI